MKLPLFFISYFDSWPNAWLRDNKHNPRNWVFPTLEVKKPCGQGWGAWAGHFWLLWAGASWGKNQELEPLKKRNRSWSLSRKKQGAGAAQKKQEPEPELLKK